MERKAIDQILRQNQIELDEEVKKNLINDLLNIHHQELSAEKDRADQANNTIAELQRNYDTAIKNSENLDSLKTEITSLKQANKKAIADIQAQYQTRLLNSAIELALTQAGARNNKAAAALIDTSNLKLNDDGTVLGLSELIDAVKNDESSSFLFEQPTQEEKEKVPEKERVYNYIPQTDVESQPVNPIDAMFDSRRTMNSKIEGWE